jgi:protein SCO1/2
MRWGLMNGASATLLLVALALAPGPRTAAGGTRWGADYFPNVPLTTQDGTVVHFYDDLLKDKIVAIDLVYTHCRYVCPLETARLAQVQRILGDRVGKDIFFYSISIDPRRDTPAVLKAYAEKFHVGPGWLFLTGKPEDVKLVSRKLGLFFEPSPGKRDGHTADLMVGNVATGQWMRNSAVDNPQFLAMMIGDFLESWRNNDKARKSYAEAPGVSIASKGQYLFATRCAACHTVGHGDRIGPDLRGVTSVRDRAWLARFLAAPDKMLAEGDPIASELYARYKQVKMPNLRLGEADVAALIEYLEAQSATPDKDAPAGGAAAAMVRKP